jgi:transforming growth factor-beta-induced protein
MKFRVPSFLLVAAIAVSACTTPLPPVFAPPGSTQPTAAPEAPAEEPAKDIVDTAVAAGTFTTLAAALEAAGLVDTLKGEGPFTVFAPTDDAFKKLPAGTVEGLLKDPKALGDILLYHVVPGKVMAADVVNLTSADTALGKPVSIKVEDGKVFVNDAQVTATDIAAANGVIHVIDSVILPPSD